MLHTNAPCCFSPAYARQNDLLTEFSNPDVKCERSSLAFEFLTIDSQVLDKTFIPALLSQN
jgi:hypothetical protein